VVLFTMGTPSLIDSRRGTTVTTSAVAVQPAEPFTSPAARHLQCGQDHCAAGRIDEAIAVLQAGLDAAGRDAANSPAEMIAGLHAELGNAYMRRGLLNLASGNYKAALGLAPHLTSSWCDLGDVHLKRGRAQDAIPLYLQALKLNPAHWASRTKLVEALMATRQYLAARALLHEMLAEQPQVGQIQYQLGKVCFELNETESAFRTGDCAEPRRCRQLLLDRRYQAEDGRHRCRSGRLRRGGANLAADPALFGARVRAALLYRATPSPGTRPTPRGRY
jgi:tetratricopeptide (TPR) repeat protein